MHARDQGFGLGVQFTYDAQGRLATKTTVQMKQTYVFDPNSGNLSSRDYRTAGSQTGLYESFGYDTFNRLTSSTIGNNTASVTYSANGNISTKSNVGGYTYDPTKVNAVSNISVSGGTIDPTQQTITYNASNLTTQIEYGTTLYNIKYNPYGERIKTVKTQTGNSTITKYYSGSYEKKITGTAVTEFHYINSPYGLVAIIESIGTGIQNTWYVETDHLGSIIGLLRSDKSYAANLSFDAWGRRRNPVDWTYQGFTTPTLTDRGFTGHEHLDSLGLINANGRMYDPVIGRFLGVDPLVADGDNSQSFNSYSYTLNNPLKFTDPSGFVLRQLPEYNGYSVSSANLALRLIYARISGADGDDCNSIISDVNWYDTGDGQQYADNPSNWQKFSGIKKAISYISKNQQIYDKEMFFYVVKNNQVIVGPWEDATHLTISYHYADIYNRNGDITFNNESFKVLRFVHTHPNNPYPSEQDIIVRDWFKKNGGSSIYFEILYNGVHYRY